MSVLDHLARVPASRKLALAVVLFAMAGTIYYFARYNALSAQSDQLARQEVRLQAEKLQVDEAHQSYQRDLHRLENLRADAHKARQILPRRVQMASLLENLHDQAEVAGLEIALVQPLDEVGEASESNGIFAKIPVELHLRGRYHELARFFHAVGRLDRIVNIEDINLEPPDTGELLSAQVLATTFRELEQETP